MRRTPRSIPETIGEVPGCYVITLPATGVFYIGSTKNLKQRNIQHHYQLKRNIHPNRKLQEAYNVNSEIHFGIVDVSTSQRDSYRQECVLIQEFKGNPLLANTHFPEIDKPKLVNIGGLEFPNERAAVKGLGMSAWMVRKLNRYNEPGLRSRGAIG